MHGAPSARLCDVVGGAPNFCDARRPRRASWDRDLSGWIPGPRASFDRGLSDRVGAGANEASGSSRRF
eukprot:7613089-Alexandrium_andersonii.AAC.1